MKEETPPLPPLFLLIHCANLHWAQEQLDRREEEGGSQRSCLKWTSTSSSSIFSVGQPLVCQVECAPSRYILNVCPDLFSAVHFSIPRHFLLSFSLKMRMLGLSAVNHMQVDRVRHTLNKGSHAATHRPFSPLWHRYVYHFFLYCTE